MNDNKTSQTNDFPPPPPPLPPPFNHKVINSGQFNHLCIWAVPVLCLDFAPLFPIVDLMNQSAHKREQNGTTDEKREENGNN